MSERACSDVSRGDDTHRTSGMDRSHRWGAALLLASAALSGCDPGAASTEPPPPSPPLPRLMTSGKNIVERDAPSKVVALRGVVFTAGVWEYSASPALADLPSIQHLLSEDDFARVASWGGNTAVLYLNYHWFESPAGFDFIHQVLSWCRSSGLHLIPSLTIYPVGGPRGGPAFFSSQAAKDQLKAFWTDFAREFRGHPEIAGYDLLNEPFGDSYEAIAAYQTELLDAVRVEDAEVMAFIEPSYGVAAWFQPIDRSNLVYDAHFYEPNGFTSQGWPWIFQHGVPIGVHYPNQGDLVLQIPTVPGGTVYQPVVPGGTQAAWQKVSVDAIVPDGADSAFFSLFSNGDAGATVWYDGLGVSIDGGPVTPVRNGSFEDQNPVSNDPDYWQLYVGAQGTATRTNESAEDGAFSVRIAGSTGWSEVTNYNNQYTVGTLPGVQVLPGQHITVEVSVKATHATEGKNGVQIYFAAAERAAYGKADLEADLEHLLGSFSDAREAPILIGEFTPSLLGPRPDVSTYIHDLASFANQRGFSWTFYEYRDTFGPDRFMGLYNGPINVDTPGCVEDTDVITTLKGVLR